MLLLASAQYYDKNQKPCLEGSLIASNAILCYELNIAHTWVTAVVS